MALHQLFGIAEMVHCGHFYCTICTMVNSPWNGKFTWVVSKVDQVPVRKRVTMEETQRSNQTYRGAPKTEHLRTEGV